MSDGLPPQPPAPELVPFTFVELAELRKDGVKPEQVERLLGTALVMKGAIEGLTQNLDVARAGYSFVDNAVKASAKPRAENCRSI